MYDDNFIIPKYMLRKVEEQSDIIGMVRGDIVLMKGFENYIGSYNNDGSYIFDGAELIDLSILKQEEREILFLSLIQNNNITLTYWYEKYF